MSNNYTPILIALAAIIYILYSQYKEKPVKGKSYIITPIILIFIGYSDLKSLNGNLSMYIPVLTMLCALFLIIGIVSGFFIKFYKKEDGILYQKGGVISIIFILIGLSLREVFRFSLMHTSYALLAKGSLLIVLLLGFQYAGRSLIAIYREPSILQEFQESRRNKNR